MYNIENAEGAPIKEKKFFQNWREWHVVYLAGPVVCLLLFLSEGLLCYCCGRLGHRMTDIVCMMYPAIALLLVFCFSASTARLLGGWMRHTWRGRLLIAAEIVIPVIVSLLCVATIFAPITSPLPPSGVAFLHGFARRVESRADVPAMRQWLSTLDKGLYVQRHDFYSTDKLPDPLKGLGLGQVFLSADQIGKPTVNFSAGGGFNHWGATIGTEDMMIPESELIHYDAWVLVEPGVYVYAW